MLVKIINDDELYRFHGLLEFIDAVIDSNMRHYASEIIELVEMGNEKEIINAMIRAQDACRALDIPVEEHFKKVYRDDLQHRVICDYKLSPLAFGLICINANPKNKNIARIQVELINKLLGK